MRREATKRRLDSILSGDCEEMNAATRAAAQADFTRLAKEYFETDGVSFSVKKGKNGTEVVLTFRAKRVKNFVTLK